MKYILVKVWRNLSKNPEEFDKVADALGLTEVEIKTSLQNINFEDKIVLDIGSGTGRLTMPISKVAKKVCAIEPESKMLESMKENIKKTGIDNVEIKKSSAENIPYPNDYFDIVLCAYILPYLKSFEKSFNEIIRVLKKGGSLLVIDHYGNDDWEKLSMIEDPKNIGRYDKRNKKLLELIKNFKEIKTKIVYSLIEFPNIEIAKEFIKETKGPKSSKYIEKNKILKIRNKIFFVLLKNK